MNITRISIEELKQHCIDLEHSMSSKINAIETERLTLKHRTENVINDALKGLDDLFETEESDIYHNNVSNNKICIKRTEKCQKPPKDLQIIIEEPKINDNSTVAKKYFDIWRDKTNKKKQQQQKSLQSVNELKEEQIDKFIQGLKAKRKAKSNKDTQNARIKSSGSVRSSSSDCSSKHSNTNRNKTPKSEIYQNRYKAQRDIILMQKSKLIEQEQKIHELQFGKICDALKESYNETQDTIKHLLKKFSTRTKVVTGVKIIEEPEEVQMKINKVPRLVRLMEQRAQERELKRQMIQERKRLIDEEKKRLLAEQLENKRIQDEEEKKQALDAIKDRRRKELEEEKRRQAEKEKFIRKCKMADKFYSKILKRRAIASFKLAVQQQQYNENISVAFYETVIIRKYMHKWRTNARNIQEMKIQKAEEHYQTKLKRNVVKRMLAVRFKAKQNMQVAVDYHAYQVECKVFKAYYLCVNAIKIRRYHLTTVAIKHYKTRLLVQAFYQWKSLPAILQLERTKEEKKRMWREIVLQIVPDYKPPELF